MKDIIYNSGTTELDTLYAQMAYVHLTFMWPKLRKLKLKLKIIKQ